MPRACLVRHTQHDGLWLPSHPCISQVADSKPIRSMCSMHFPHVFSERSLKLCNTIYFAFLKLAHRRVCSSVARKEIDDRSFYLCVTHTSGVCSVAIISLTHSLTLDPAYSVYIYWSDARRYAGIGRFVVVDSYMRNLCFMHVFCTQRKQTNKPIETLQDLLCICLALPRSLSSTGNLTLLHCACAAHILQYICRCCFWWAKSTHKRSTICHPSSRPRWGKSKDTHTTFDGYSTSHALLTSTTLRRRIVGGGTVRECISLFAASSIWIWMWWLCVCVCVIINKP